MCCWMIFFCFFSSSSSWRMMIVPKKQGEKRKEKAFRLVCYDAMGYYHHDPLTIRHPMRLSFHRLSFHRLSFIIVIGDMMLILLMQMSTKICCTSPWSHSPNYLLQKKKKRCYFFRFRNADGKANPNEPQLGTKDHHEVSGQGNTTTCRKRNWIFYGIAKLFDIIMTKSIIECHISGMKKSWSVYIRSGWWICEFFGTLSCQ